MFSQYIWTIELKPDDKVYHIYAERIRYIDNKICIVRGKVGNYFYENSELPIKFIREEHKYQVQNFNSKL